MRAREEEREKAGEKEGEREKEILYIFVLQF